MGNIMQKWAKTGHFWNQNSSRTNRQIQFLYYGWKEHELEIQFHTTLTGKKWNKVIILASKLKKMNFYGDVIFVYVELRLSWLSVINFLQILICCSWDNSLLAKWHLFLILMTSSQSNLRLKATVHNFSYLRVISMGDHFFSQTGICMTMFFAQYLGCYFTIFSQILVCCSWDYKLIGNVVSDF